MQTTVYFPVRRCRSDLLFITSTLKLGVKLQKNGMVHVCILCSAIIYLRKCLIGSTGLNIFTSKLGITASNNRINYPSTQVTFMPRQHVHERVSCTSAS